MEIYRVAFRGKRSSTKASEVLLAISGELDRAPLLVFKCEMPTSLTIQVMGSILRPLKSLARKHSLRKVARKSSDLL